MNGQTAKQSPDKRRVEQIRAEIIADPSIVLGDFEVVRTLAEAEAPDLGNNIVDLRSVAVGMLEERLERAARDRSRVIAAAEENYNGTNQIHNAVLEVLQAGDMSELLDSLFNEVPELIGVYCTRIIDEQGFIEDRVYGQVFDEFVLDDPPVGYEFPYDEVAMVMLRQVGSGPTELYGGKGTNVRSEALISLSLADGSECLLVLASSDPNQFATDMQTSLLEFLGTVIAMILSSFDA